ncbi:DUF4214 domain-containing protein [Phaeobacter sp. J2-8]|uniref:DUF4214 domain-containing protein n=1 Tax=Phaeobacter sp. J2-8 TaxID=2931394 RepID=UPI001FD10209|nr:DUF4214 domain-containing protein [Phaeobacter sp. J2-8]MCJ7874807.1 DUF4214 domain-containing protein [Phaeobacter sp. J2-8]
MIGDENIKVDGFVADVVPSGGTVFGDGLAALYFPDVAAQVYRLYQTTLGRVPDAAGHSAWTGRIAVEGQAVLDVVQGFVGSPEFQAQFGGLDNAEFVTLLYNNVLGRDPDATGLANWTGRLEDGMTRAEVVRGFSDSPEFRADTEFGGLSLCPGQCPAKLERRCLSALSGDA